MREYKVEPIRSLGRGLDVIAALHQLGAASLHDLHRATGIPKATLTRILVTAHQHGMVWQRLADGAFLPSHRLDRFRDSQDRTWLVELASPVLERLVARTGWPSVLAVPRGSWMDILETSSRRARVDDVRFTGTPYRANLLRSASGRAYLSNCAPDERDRVLDALAGVDRPGHALAHDRPSVEAMVRATRARGYALRHPDFGGDYDLPRSQHDDGRASLAVPIRRGYAIGSINVTWRRTAMTTTQAVRRHLSHLQEAACEIEDLAEAH